MSRIGGDDEDTFPNGSKLDSQATAGQTTQVRLVMQGVEDQDSTGLNKRASGQQHVIHMCWAVSLFM